METLIGLMIGMLFVGIAIGMTGGRKAIFRAGEIRGFRRAQLSEQERFKEFLRGLDPGHGYVIAAKDIAPMYRYDGE